MKLNKLKLQKGFTIIEVMIVLAIAGLIMVIVFIAVPQLQRSERNTARKSVMDRVKTEVDNYSSNNNGDIPVASNDAQKGFVGTGGGFYKRYISKNASNFNDPQTGSVMSFASMTAVGDVTSNSTIYYKTGVTCDGEQLGTGTARNYALMNLLEGDAIQCLDNK